MAEEDVFSTQLQNSFVDLLLVVGLDDNSLLIPSAGQEVEENKIFDNLYTMTFEPQVLTAVTSSNMTHFFPVVRKDLEYLPQQKSSHQYMKQHSAVESLPRTRFNKSIHASSKGALNRSNSVSPMLISRHVSFRHPPRNLKKAAHTTPISVPTESPISEEVIKSIPTFCFPDNMKIECYRPDSIVHYLVLTDMSGNNTYATCVTFYRSFIVFKDEQDNIYMSLNTTKDQLKVGQKRCYIPHCCVLISRYPYFSVMKECLSYMVLRIEQEPESMYDYVRKFAYTMTLTPVPPAGNVAIEFHISLNQFILYPPESADKPVVDIPLHLAFLCFSDEDILKILSALLVEERIVFISSNFALLFIIMESFRYFILPFTWRFTYVPILAARSLELLEAPGTFMMGCHAVHKKEVEQVEGLVIVNIDIGSVSINHQSSGYDGSINNGYMNGGSADIVDIPSIPEDAAKIFSVVCKKARFQYDLVDSQRPSAFDMMEEKLFRRKVTQQLNSDISAGCLQLMINLFRSVVLELRTDHQQFNKQAFLDRLSTDKKSFYERVFKGEMFKDFLRDRMKEKSDYWSEAELRTRPAFAAKRRSIGDASVPSLLNRHPMKNVPSAVSLDVFLNPEKKTVIFKVMRIGKDLRHYISSTISSLTETLQTCQDYQERASYTYLRGMFHLAAKDVIQAFEDFTKLEGIDRSILPTKLVQQIFDQFDKSDRDEFMKRPAIQALQDILVSTSVHHHTKIEENISIPSGNLSFDDFSKVLSLREMARNYDTIENVFKALTLDQPQSYIDHVTFEAFYECWQANHISCSEVDDSKLLEAECVLKISSLCKTDFGTGRVALTDKRLLFLKDVSQDYREVIKIRDITELNKLQLNSFLVLKLDVLQVKGKGDVKFCAWLKEERNHWYILMKEMWSGKVVSEAMKDIAVVGQAAENVCVIDAVVQSGQIEETFHSSAIEDALKYLCYFSKYIEEGKHNLPEGTRNMLQNRLDPNIGQGRQSVQALLYTIGDSKVPPKLWCGMGDGKIKIYDATNWTLETVFVQTKLSVSCLVALGKQVWAGSHGIFIIDIDTVRSNKTLSDHEDIVMDIESIDNGRYAYTGSIDGVIHKWDVQTLTIVQGKSIKSTSIKPLRKLKYCSGHLWCGSWLKVVMMDLQGIVVREFKYVQEECTRPLELDCFEVVEENHEIFAGSRRDGQLIVWDSNNGDVKVMSNLKCKGFSVMMRLEDKLWIGTKDGSICILDIYTREIDKTLTAHDDAVRSICSAEGRYILSGSGSLEGKIAIWNPRELQTESGRFPLLTSE